MNPSCDALNIARTISAGLDHDGAAVVGSVARGEATLESDIDLYLIGDGPEYQLIRQDSWLISLSWRTPDQLKSLFQDPEQAVCGIAGWRDAMILYDPDQQLHAHQAEARNWTWSVIGDAAIDTWVAEEITGYAEEAQKLVRVLREDDMILATVQRVVLAVRLARPIAVHRRMICRGENELWRLVNQELGEPWASIQTRALGLGSESPEESCRAALGLFQLACQEIDDLIDERQRSVVDGALKLAHPSLMASERDVKDL